MKTVCGAIAVALALIGSPATAQAEEPHELSLREFLAACDDHLDDCRSYLNDFVLSGMKMSNNPEPVCVPVERSRAAVIMLAGLTYLARDPYWAEGPDWNAMMQAMTDAFPCLTDY